MSFSFGIGANGQAFYKGTAFPLITEVDCEFPKKAQEMMVKGLKHGISLAQQGKEYKEQMDLMESTLCDIAKGQMITQNHINTWCKKMGTDEDTLMDIWYMNVIALEKLKVIKSDNMNGMLYMFEKSRK